jgi:hypothetical protein
MITQLSHPWTYRGLTALFCLFGLGTGLGDLTSNSTVLVDLHQLGYPMYLAPMLGVFKILGVLALIAPGLPTLKEWAYAGFAFDLGGAIFSSLAIGVFDSDTLLASIGLVLLAAAYFSYSVTRARNLPVGLLRFMRASSLGSQS